MRDREVAVHSNTNRPEVVRARFSGFKPEARELALSLRCAWHKVQIRPTKEVLVEAIECRFTLRGEFFLAPLDKLPDFLLLRRSLLAQHRRRPQHTHRYDRGKYKR